MVPLHLQGEIILSPGSVSSEKHRRHVFFSSGLGSPCFGAGCSDGAAESFVDVDEGLSVVCLLF